MRGFAKVARHVGLWWVAFSWLNCNAEPAKADYIIRGDRGGEIVQYIFAFQRVGGSGEKVVVDGDCLSACTLIFGFVPPERIYVTPKARFGFHSAWRPNDKGQPVYSKDGTELLLEYYPPWVHSWLKRHGGLKRRMVYLKGTDLAGMYQPYRGRLENMAAAAPIRRRGAFPS